MSPKQVTALRWIAKYGTTRGGGFAKNTVQSLVQRKLIKYDFDAEYPDQLRRGGYRITEEGQKVLTSIHEKRGSRP